MTRLKDLSKTPQNPRVISPARAEALKDSLQEFGSLDGVVYNRARKQLVGAHQRATLEPDAEVIITKRYDPPDELGTVAEGYVDAGGGVRIPYREVHWQEEGKHLAAVVAANKHGGEWDRQKLAEVIVRIDELNFDVAFTGYNVEEVAGIVAPLGLPPGSGGNAGESGVGTGQLAERFMIPPFSVLNAREGWWQERKRQWIGLGIQSELGRGGGAPHDVGASDGAGVKLLPQSLGAIASNEGDILKRRGKYSPS